MLLLIVMATLLFGGALSYRFAARFAPHRVEHLVHVPGQQAEQLWVFNVRDMWVELRANSYTMDALAKYDLRRADEERWELRIDPAGPTPRHVLFPASIPRTDPEGASNEEQPWLPCGPPVDGQLEAAYRKYNGIDDDPTAPPPR